MFSQVYSQACFSCNHCVINSVCGDLCDVWDHVLGRPRGIRHTCLITQWNMKYNVPQLETKTRYKHLTVLYQQPLLTNPQYITPSLICCSLGHLKAWGWCILPDWRVWYVEVGACLNGGYGWLVGACTCIGMFIDQKHGRRGQCLGLQYHTIHQLRG